MPLSRQEVLDAIDRAKKAGCPSGDCVVTDCACRDAALAALGLGRVPVDKPPRWNSRDDVIGLNSNGSQVVVSIGHPYRYAWLYPRKAREMAAALVAHADYIEGNADA